MTRRELIELVQLAGRQREVDQAREQAIAKLTPREREVLLALAAGLIRISGSHCAFPRGRRSRGHQW